MFRIRCIYIFVSVCTFLLYHIVNLVASSYIEFVMNLTSHMSSIVKCAYVELFINTLKTDLGFCCLTILFLWQHQQQQGESLLFYNIFFILLLLLFLRLVMVVVVVVLMVVVVAEEWKKITFSIIYNKRIVFRVISCGTMMILCCKCVLKTVMLHR